MQEDRSQLPAGGKRRRDSDELLDLIREDTRLQRERQKAHKRRETFDRLFSLLSKKKRSTNEITFQ